MIIDNLLVLSDAQAVTASAASTNVIDTLAAGFSRNPGVRFQVLVNTTAAATGGASETAFSLEDSADNSSYAAIYTSAAIAKATLVAGYVAVDVEVPAHRRYLRAYYTVTTNDLTSGKFDARIVESTGRTIDKAI